LVKTKRVEEFGVVSWGSSQRVRGKPGFPVRSGGGNQVTCRKRLSCIAPISEKRRKNCLGKQLERPSGQEKKGTFTKRK